LQKFLSALLALALCLAMAMPVFAEKKEQIDPKKDEKVRISNNIRNCYYTTLANAGVMTGGEEVEGEDGTVTVTGSVKSISGYCGVYSGYSLWLMGITAGAYTVNGNDQFDYYKDMSVTDMGYRVMAHGAHEGTMEQILNKLTNNGRQDVYNILLGFHWTETAAGSKFGHTLVIHAIIDGMVYAGESYDCPLAPAGSPIICTIQEFCDYYSSWTLFEGLIHFARDYEDYCTGYQAELYGMSAQNAQLLSIPCVEGMEGSTVLRTVPAGERLHITAMVCNPYGQFYYRVEEEDRNGYIAVDAVRWEFSLLWNRQQGWCLEDGYWRYYQGGEPVTGWLNHKGIDYYLDEQGNALTGWQEVDGQKRYFSPTGAMRTGWMDTAEGRLYLLKNGVAAQGWRRIDGQLYCFDENGYALTEQQAVCGSRTYSLDRNGIATEQ